MDSPRLKGCCAHGLITIAPIVLVFVATLFTWVYTWDCRFFVTKEDDDYWNEDEHKYRHGLWTVQSETGNGDEYCYQYKLVSMEQGVDGPLKFARGTSLVSSLVSLPSLIVICLFSCISFNRVSIVAMASVFFFLAVLSMLTLSALASDLCKDEDDCKLGADGALCVLSFFLWVAAGVVTILLVKPDPHLKPQQQQQQPQKPAATATATATEVPAGATTSNDKVEEVPQEPTETEVVEESANSDGTVTRVTTTTQTGADGMQTVMKKVEVLAQDREF